MNIKLCSSISEIVAINKDVSIIDDVSATIKGALSVENPVLILQYKSDIQSKVNYVYIPEYNRYYFVTDIINLTGGRYELHCKVDVLMSFKDYILNLSCIVDKQSSKDNANMYLDDGSFVVQSKEFVDTINFPRGFNDNGEFILITAGGGVTV